MGKINNYSVYWIHLPKHLDKTSQGYIGITKDIKSRWKGHLNKNNSCVHLRNAINKYDNLVWDILYTNIEKELAELIEFELRPTPKIGWNLRTGGHVIEWSKDSIYKSGQTRRKKIRFTHQIHGDRLCSVQDLLEEFNDLSQSGLSYVVSGKYKSSKGWRLKSTDLSETKDGSQIYKWKHKEHGERYCTIKELSKEFEFKSLNKLYSVVKNQRKSCNGWTLQKGEL